MMRARRLILGVSISIHFRSMTVRRVTLLSSLLAALAASLGAQTPAAVSRGTKLRLTITVFDTDVPLPPTRAVGRLERVHEDTVVLLVSGPQVYLKRNISAAEQSVGQHHPFMKGAVFGTMFGTSVGWAIGKLMKPAWRCTQPPGGGATTCIPPDPTITGYKKAMPVGAGLGLASGIYISSRMVRDIWSAVQVSDLR